MKRTFLAVAALTAFATAFGTVVVRASVAHRSDVPVPGAAWSIGFRDGANLFRMPGSSVLYGNAQDATFQGRRYIEIGQDGNFEFEHAYGTVESRFDARTIDGSHTPIQIGLADGQNVTPLVVPGNPRMTVDIQSWQVGAATPSGIDLHGRVRLNGIVLFPLVRNSRVQLYAVLPDGTLQHLVPVARG